MGKKHKAKLKEIERLRALYQQADNNTVTTEYREERVYTTAPSTTSADANVASDDHSYVRRDIVGLVILIVVMLAILFVFDWLVQNTTFSGWLIGLFGV